MDWSSFSAAGAAPGNDTRQWISMGIVTADDAGQIVQFREDLGQPLVRVLLQPSMTPVYARVGMQVAGNGEGEWHPFIQGDEVLVALPEGYEDANVVILARLSNFLDKFPMDSIAGQDPTTNTFGFSRRRTPFVHEYAGPVILRSALSSALITIDTVGSVTIKDSENSAMQISADVIGFVGPSSPESPPEFLLQLDLTHRHFSVQVGDAFLTLSASDASPEVNTITVPGPFSVGTAGNPALEHVATTESVANVLEKVFAIFAAFTTTQAGPLTGASYGAAMATWIATPAFAAAWATAATSPLGAVSTTLPQVISGLFAAAPPKPSTGASQLFPGVGCPAFFVG